MMMNALALGLVLTSLVTAGFFTPCPEKQNLKQDVIVKQGHRVIVVEYEKDDGNTKVSISPQDSHKIDETEAKDKLSEKMANLKEGAKEASSSVLPEMGMKLDNQEEDVEAHHGFSARELVCDAYGKCKHKLASAMGKTTEAVAEEAKEAVGKAKDTVSETAHKAYDKVHEAKESAKDSATEISTKAKEKAAGVKEAAKEQENKAKRHVHEVRENVEREVSGKIEGTKEMVEEKAKHVRREGKKELREILRHAREVAVDVFDYVFSTERLSPWAGVLHLMGFAAAYGMCVWVTFASSYVLAGALPRNQFAMVQSKVYPVYFKAMAYSVGIAMLGHLMSPRKRLSGGGGMFQGFNLTAALAMILVNLLYLEPRATKVMMERMKKEKEEGRGKEGTTEPIGRVVDSTAEAAGRVSGTGGTIGSTVVKQPTEEAAAKSQIIRLSETLQRLNSHSSLLNILTLMSLTWHLVHLGQRLNAAC